MMSLPSLSSRIRQWWTGIKAERRRLVLERKDAEARIVNATSKIQGLKEGRGWVTTLELRQPPGNSHEVAFEQALDVAQELVRRGLDVTLGPTLPDEPASPAWFGTGEEPA